MANQTGSTDGKRPPGSNRPESHADVDTDRQYVDATVRVERPMNSYGGMRLSTDGGSQTFQVVDYATDEIRDALGRTDSGTTLEIQLVTLGARGNAWRAVAVTSGEQSHETRVAPTG